MNAHTRQRGSLLFLGLLLVAGVLLFFFWWLRSPEFPLRRTANDSKTEAERIADGVKYRVEITNKGFVPGQLTIEPYDTVSFINRDTVKHYPVAGDLDGEKVCEEFGQGREIMQNEAYVVVFTERDECAFSDKLNEDFSAGTIFIE